MQNKHLYLPTPQQIARACAAIQNNWSDAERRRRSIGAWHYDTVRPWTPPSIDTSVCLYRVRRMVADLAS